MPKKRSTTKSRHRTTTTTTTPSSPVTDTATCTTTSSNGNINNNNNKNNQGMNTSFDMTLLRQNDTAAAATTTTIVGSAVNAILPAATATLSWDEHDIVGTSTKFTQQQQWQQKKRSYRIRSGSGSGSGSYSTAGTISTGLRHSNSNNNDTNDTNNTNIDDNDCPPPQPPTTPGSQLILQQQQQYRLKSYQQYHSSPLTTTTTNPNKLPATPASIRKRNQRIRALGTGGQPPSHPPSQQHSFTTAVVVTTPVQLYHHHHHRHHTDDTTCTPSISYSGGRLPRLPPLLDDNENNNNNKSVNHHLDYENVAFSSSSSSKQQQQQFSTMTVLRRKSKRSFGTCTTTASSCDYNNYNNNHADIHGNDDDDNNDDDDDNDDDDVFSMGGGDHHSVDTNDTSMTATKNFRFTSFPASLPRIHNTNHNYKNNNDSNNTTTTTIMPLTIRKHMTFTTSESQQQKQQGKYPMNNNNHHHRHHSHTNTNNNDSHNTSLSSWNNNHDHHGFNSDDDDHEEEVNDDRYEFNETSSSLAQEQHQQESLSFYHPTPRARLNFNTVPAHSLQRATDDDEVHDDNDEEQEMMDDNDDDMMCNHHDDNATTTTARRSVRSFIKNLTTTDMSPIRGTAASSCVLFGPTGEDCATIPHNNDNHDDYDYLPTNEGPFQQLQFQLDAAQCSPIPGIPEKACKTTNDDDDIDLSPCTTIENSKLLHNDKRTPNSRRRRITNSSNNSLLRLRPPGTNCSNESSTTTTVTSQLSTRPMPDMHAFEDVVTQHYRHPSYDVPNHPTNPNDASRLSSSSLSSLASTTTNIQLISSNDDQLNAIAVVPMQGPSLSPKLLCPPTPVRVHPIFRTTNNNNSFDEPEQQQQHHHHPPLMENLFHPPQYQKQRQKIERSNSLIATKIIATCSPQLLLHNKHTINRTSIDGTTGSRHMEGEGTTILHQPTRTITKKYPHDYSRHNNNMTMTNNNEISSTISTAIDVTQNHSGPEQLSLNSSHRQRNSISVIDVTTAEVPPPTVTQVASISLATNFDVISTLGSGTFADVYKVVSKTDHKAYAIKRNRRQFRSKRDREVLLSEVRCMQRLQSQMTSIHQQEQEQNDFSMYLLFFYQAWQEDGHIYCQTELCCRDTCRELIDTIQYWNPSVSSIKFPTIATSWMVQQQQQQHTTSVGTGGCGGGRVVPEQIIWKICHDICAGLSYIHSSKVGLVHNDIKPSNILFVKHTSRYGAICKIGDFGMARNVGSSEDGQEGDQKYMALEMLEYGTSYPSADIFSLGLTLYEMTSHIQVTIPPDGNRWHELRSGNINYYMNDFPSDRSNELVQLIRTMMDPNPIRRPSADDILSMSLVHEAGNTPNKFLHDYVDDIERYEIQEEEWMMQGVHTNAVSNNNNGSNNIVPFDEQTPRNASTRPLCSPPINKLPPLPFALLPSPTALQQP